MSYHLAPWRPLDHAPFRNPLVPDVRITAGRSRGFLEPYPYIELKYLEYSKVLRSASCRKVLEPRCKSGMGHGQLRLCPRSGFKDTVATILCSFLPLSCEKQGAERLEMFQKSWVLHLTVTEGLMVTCFVMHP